MLILSFINALLTALYRERRDATASSSNDNFSVNAVDVNKSDKEIIISVMDKDLMFLIIPTFNIVADGRRIFQITPSGH
ncbi:MAG TPA: hypothetical protein PKK26_06495 [Candidatus Wallbacteria bacterium]|nr:hypothetical protein [Candidatus Wallbacteria bacterium]